MLGMLGQEFLFVAIFQRAVALLREILIGFPGLRRAILTQETKNCYHSEGNLGWGVAVRRLSESLPLLETVLRKEKQTICKRENFTADFSSPCLQTTLARSAIPSRLSLHQDTGRIFVSRPDGYFPRESDNERGNTGETLISFHVRRH